MSLLLVVSNLSQITELFSWLLDWMQLSGWTYGCHMILTCVFLCLSAAFYLTPVLSSLCCRMAKRNDQQLNRRLRAQVWVALNAVRCLMLLLRCKSLSLWAYLSRQIISPQKLGYSYFLSLSLVDSTLTHQVLNSAVSSCFQRRSTKLFLNYYRCSSREQCCRWRSTGMGPKWFCFSRVSLFLLTVLQLHILCFQSHDLHILGLVGSEGLRPSFLLWFSSLLISEWE